jgi:hypothetical protein
MFFEVHGHRCAPVPRLDYKVFTMGSHFDRFKLHLAKSLTYAAKHGGVAHLCRRQSGGIDFHMNSSRKANARIIRHQIL